MDDETQSIADARETRALVIATTLRLAGRVIEKVALDGELSFAVLSEEYDAGGFEWQLTAATGRGHDFVRVTGKPEVTDRVMVSHEEMERIMGNQNASFDTQVPREWIELALVGTRDTIDGIASDDR